MPSASGWIAWRSGLRNWRRNGAARDAAQCHAPPRELLLYLLRYRRWRGEEHGTRGVPDDVVAPVGTRAAGADAALGRQRGNDQVVAAFAGQPREGGPGLPFQGLLVDDAPDAARPVLVR